VGVATLLFGAIGIFAHLDLSFDRIWKVPPATETVGYLRTFYNVVHGKFRAFLMMLIMGLVMIAAFIGSMVISGMREYAAALPAGHFLWHLTQTATGVLINSLYFFVIYKSLSKRKVRWREAAAGGLLAGIAWEIGRQVLASFVIGKNYSAYGIVGAFIAMLLWFFYASCLLFYGAEYVQVLAKKREAADGVQSPPNPVATGASEAK
jgi:membrane protein